MLHSTIPTRLVFCLLTFPGLVFTHLKFDLNQMHIHN